MMAAGMEGGTNMANEISWIKVSKKKFYEIINQIQEQEAIIWMPYLYYIDRTDWRHKKDVGRIEKKEFGHRYWINSDYLK